MSKSYTADEEDDYMSDKFLPKDAIEKDLNSLINTKNTKKRKNSTETEQNKKPIDSSNIGFQLLTSMGYTSKDYKEPIQPVLLTKREGLGVSTLREEQDLEELREFNEKILEEKQNEEMFIKKKSIEFEARNIKKELKSARMVVEDLDRNKDLKSEFWFSDFVIREKEAREKNGEKEYSCIEEGSDDGLDGVKEKSEAEKLREILNYLRRIHFYCLYCGCCFENEEEMESECPGIFKVDHD